MKKYYGIHYLRCKRILEENLAKFRYLTQMCSYNKSTRICAKSNYKELRHDENKSFKIPNDITFNPTVIIIYDLIPKSELRVFIKGWKRLSGECSAPKFINNIDEAAILSYIKGLQYNLSLKSWLNIGIFNVPKINDIRYFNFRIYNFSTSLCMLRFSVYLSRFFQYKCHRLFKGRCRDSILKSTHSYVGKNKQYNELFMPFDSIKHRDWCELIAKLKWKFLNFINKILKFNLIFFNHNIESPSILMIDTHIPKVSIPKDISLKDSLKFHYKYKGYIYFKSATGFSNSCSINGNERMTLSDRPYYNIQYFHNSKNIVIDNESIRHNIALLIKNREAMLDDSGELLCLDISNDIRRKYTYIYITHADKIKMKWRKYKHILKEKFNYKNSIGPFNIIKNEISWAPLIKLYNLMWPKIDPHNNPNILCSPKILVGTLNISNILNYLISKENKRINSKIELLKNLSEQKQNHKRLMLIFAVLAFVISILSLLGDLNLNIFVHNIICIIKFIIHLIFIIHFYS